MNISKLAIGTVLALVILSQTGCFSYVAYDYNRKNAIVRKARLMNDDAAIKAVQLGNNGVGIGIDVTALESLGSVKALLLQTAAALGDAVVIGAAQEGLNSLNQSLSDKNNTLTINNNGDGYINVTITQNTSTTTINVDKRTTVSVSDNSQDSHDDSSVR